MDALKQLSESSQGVREGLILKAWIGGCMVLGSDERHIQAKGLLNEILPDLRSTAAVALGDAELSSAWATAEAVAGWIAICANEDATAHIQFRRAIQAYDTCSKCEPEDALFAAYFYIVTSMDPDMSPQATYEWSRPYLQVLPPLHCRYGAQLLELLGDWFYIEGDVEGAKRMYSMLLEIADVEQAHEASKQTVQELVVSTKRKVREMGLDGEQ